MDDWDILDNVDDLASLWSPSKLRSSGFFSGLGADDFFSNIGDDLASLWSPSNLRSTNFLSGIDIPFSLPNLDLTSVIDTSDILSGVSDILGPSGRDRNVILNQDNPLVQTDISDIYLGGNKIPGLDEGSGFNLAADLMTDTGFAPYSPSTYYGLTNPNLSEAARSALYENISFATASGVSEFSERLAGETGDVIRMRNPENNSKYFEATPVKDAEGNVVRDGTGKPMVNVTQKDVGPGTGVIGEGETVPPAGGGGGSGGGGGAKPPGTGGSTTPPAGGNPLALASGLAMLGALTGMLNRPDTQQKVPTMPTVRDIQGVNTPQLTVQRPAIVTPGVNNPQLLATQLGAPRPMATGGLARYARGGGGGQDDKIPAYLSNGEYVMDAATVSDLGDGSNEHGARILDKFRHNIRKHKRSASASDIPPKAKSPLQYLKG